MKILLHICCAPCSNMCIELLRGDRLDVSGFWFNPNIHPFTEYRARRNCLRVYAGEIGLPLYEQNDYALRPFIRAVAGDIDNRCRVCYDIRLGTAARYARDHGYDAFTSSLFISPYQQHEVMKTVAQDAAARFGVKFLYRDFRPWFREGQQRARELGFYMQKYCGCVFSEEERYIRAKKIIH